MPTVGTIDYTAIMPYRVWAGNGEYYWRSGSTGERLIPDENGEFIIGDNHIKEDALYENDHTDIITAQEEQQRANKQTLVQKGLNAAAVASPVVGGLISGGMQSGVGNAMQSLSGLAGALPSPYGPIAQIGLNIGGGIVNGLFGSKLNQENIGKVEGNINSMSSFNSNASSTEGLLQNMQDAPTAVGFNRSFIGKDGLFSNKAKKKFNALKNSQIAAQQHVNRSFINNLQNISNTTLNNREANYIALGGPINMEYSGVMSPFGNSFAHGGEFSNGIKIINEGGTHEQNPYEGVLMGVDVNGTPNLVEEGEVIWNDYVFSNRIKAPKEVAKKFKVGGKKKRYSFADIAKKIQEESSERQDPITMRGLTADMNYLQQAQEYERIKMMQREQLRQAKNLLSQGVPLEVIQQGMMEEQQPQQMQQVPMEDQMYDQQQYSPEELAMAQQQLMALGGNLYSGITYSPLYGISIKHGVDPWLNSRDKTKGYTSQWVNVYSGNDALVTQEWLNNANWDNYRGKRRPKNINEARQWLSDRQGGPFTEFVASQLELSDPNNSNSAYRWKSQNTNANTITNTSNPLTATAWTDPRFNLPNLPTGYSIEQPQNRVFSVTRTVPDGNNLQALKESNFGEIFPNGIQYNVGPNTVETITKDDIGQNRDWQFINYGNIRGIRNKNGVVILDTPGDNLPSAEQLYGRGFSPDITYLDNLIKGLPGYTLDQFNSIRKAMGQSEFTQEDVDAYRAKNTVDLDDEEGKENYWTDLRYTPALASVMAAVSDALGWTNQPDLSSYKNLIQASRALKSSRWSPIGNRMVYRPTDTDYALNSLNAGFNANTRALNNLSGGNRGVAAAQQLANAYQYLNTIGKALYDADIQDFKKYSDVSEYNRKTDLANAEGDFKAQESNRGQEAIAADLLKQAEVNRQNAITNAENNIKVNLSAAIDNIGNLGWEEFNREMVNSNRAEYYHISRRGKVTFKNGFWSRSPEQQAEFIKELDRIGRYVDSRDRERVNINLRRSGSDLTV